MTDYLSIYLSLFQLIEDVKDHVADIRRLEVWYQSYA